MRGSLRQPSATHQNKFIMEKSKTYEILESAIKRIKDADGHAIIVAHDGESDNTMVAPILHDVEESTSVFIRLFSSFPEFIPRALCAASMVMRGEVENGYDDDDDEDDDPDDDNVPVGGCGVGCELCMN